MKSLFCLLHWILLVSMLAEKGELDNFYTWLALFAYQVLMSERILKKVQMAMNTVVHLMFWVLWAIVLTGSHDLGCSYLRLAILALPFVKSKKAIKTMQKVVKCTWQFLVWLVKRTLHYLSVLARIPWVVLTLVFPLPSVLLLVQILVLFMQSVFSIMPLILWIHILMGGFELPFLLCEAVSQIVKTSLKHAWSLYSVVKLTSVEDYIDAGHPSTIFHDSLQYRICSEDGRNLWKGFIDIVLNAYDNHRSWAGTFNNDHLRMCGSKCKIEMEASYPANCQNLLLDLAKLASLLMPHFETMNQDAPGYIQELYNSMTAPLIVLNPPPTPQQLQSFVRFMRKHPALTSARKTNSFLRKVFEACKGVDQDVSDVRLIQL